MLVLVSMVEVVLDPVVSQEGVAGGGAMSRYEVDELVLSEARCFWVAEDDCDRGGWVVPDDVLDLEFG